MTARAYQPQSSPPRGQQTGVVKYELTKTQVEQEQMVLARVDEQRALIETYLPAGVDLAQIKTDIALAVRKVPKILDCTPESILIAAAEIQRWGLQIGTTAYLVPYGTECTPVADYKGLEELVTGSGAARALRKAAVYENDYKFEIYLGSRNELVHEPMWKGGKRGAMIGAYCIAIVGRGEQLITYMRLEEIEAIRAKSKQWNPQKAGPECPEWYAIKTAVRRSCKTLPKNPRLAQLMRQLDAVDHLEFGGNPDATADVPEGEYEVMQETTAAGASEPASAARPAVEQPSAGAARGTYEWAASYTVPNSDGTRAALGDVDDLRLEKLARWADDKLTEALNANEAPKASHMALAEACGLVLLQRAEMREQLAAAPAANTDEPPADLLDAAIAQAKEFKAREEQPKDTRKRAVEMTSKNAPPDFDL